MPTATAPSGGRRRRNYRDGDRFPSTRATRTYRAPTSTVPAVSPDRPLARVDDKVKARTMRKLSKRARALMARVPCLDRASAERAAVGAPIDWARFIDAEGVPRVTALPVSI